MFNLFDIYRRYKYGTGYKGTYNYKGLNDFKYTVGETYEIKSKPQVCFNGFHYSMNPYVILKHYPIFFSSNFFEIKALGKIDVNLQEGKFSTNKIKIVREITEKDELNNLFGFYFEKQNNKTTFYFEHNNRIVEYTKIDPFSINRLDYIDYTGPMLSENTNKYYDYYIYDDCNFKYLIETYKNCSNVIKKYYFSKTFSL